MMTGTAKYLPDNFLFDTGGQQKTLDAGAQAKQLLIMLTSGNEDMGKRATLAFSAACSSVAMEKPTSVFLVGDGVFWAYAGNIKGAKVDGFPALYELMELFMDLGGCISVCSTCSITGSCSIDGSGDASRNRLMPNIQQQGFASVINYAQHGSSLTF